MDTLEVKRYRRQYIALGDVVVYVDINVIYSTRLNLA